VPLSLGVLNRPLAALIIVALLASSLAAQGTAPRAVRSAAAQIAPHTPGYVAPRTPWGDPDLQGVWPSIDVVRVPLERPRQYGTRIMMSIEEQRALEQREKDQIERTARQGAGGQIGSPGHWVEWGRSQRQTSLLVDPADGRMPALTADGKARQAKLPKGTTEYGILNGPADFTAVERCISRGVIGSMLPVTTSSGMDITQAPGYVAIRYEMIHEVRIIPLGHRPRLPRSIAQFMGDSRGRWEGATLVVETTNLSDKVGVGVNGSGPPASPAMMLTERLTRVAPETIRYEATVNDPQTFTAPFTLAFPLTLMPDYLMAEYACHEGNLGLRFALSGFRADEARGMGKE
jgi:hypothetical protein